LILSKSRLQWKSSELQYTGLLDVMQKTLRSEGPIGLYAVIFLILYSLFYSQFFF